MPTRILMASSAGFLALFGLGLVFAPQEALGVLGIAPDGALPMLLQVAGAALLGMAMINWMARGMTIGGIYARPLSMGNLVHFAVGGLALAKAGPSLHWPPYLWLLLIVYAGLAAGFGYLVFGQGAACVEN